MNTSESPGLDRSISLFQATVYGVGIILGAGIYALIGEAVGITGNAVWVSFLVAALIAGCSAISYAELSANFPRSAAEFIYVKEISGSDFFGFLFGFVTVLTGIISVAAVALGFSTYFKTYLNIDPVLVAVSIICIAALINYIGIQQSTRVNVLFTLIEAGGLIFIIFIGLPYLGDVDLLSTGMGQVPDSDFHWTPVMAAAALIFFAYIGFEDVANIAEEVKSPKTNVPAALLLSLIITTIIYVLVAMVSVSVVPAAALFEASRLDHPGQGPLALVASTALNSESGGKLFSIVALCATANTVLILHIVTSRMLYGIARENCLPEWIAKINPRTRTPINAIAVSTVFCVLFTLLGSIGEVANLTNIGVFLVFFVVNVMLLIHRYRNRHNQEYLTQMSLKLAINIRWFPLLPFFGMIFCLSMLVTQFWGPIEIFGLSLPLIVAGLGISALSIPIYYLFNFRRNPSDN